jgi:carboxypeptidase PM20D1
VTIGDPRVSITATERPTEPSRVSDVDSPAFRTLAHTIRQVVPGRPNIGPMLVTGGTDAKYYGDRSPNVFRFAPLTITLQELVRVHGTGERVAVESLATCVRFYYQLIKNMDGR